MIRRWFPPRGRITKGNKLNIRFFTFDELRIATNNFSTFLGSGGFGSVFKGVLPDDGTTVIIKKFANQHDGFLEMVELMSHIRHINLIQVIGCCVDDGRQLLVCEFAENGSVSEHLQREKAPSLDWERRASICLGTARGLSYLHEEISPGIIHRDIKPSNIVLDSNFVPKIVDFDLIRVVEKGVNPEEEKQTVSERTKFAYLDVHSPCLSTRIVGTPGYVDPDYIIKGQLTEKVDVYSFGILMLEIITGRRPVNWSQHNIDDRMLLDWVIRAKKDGMVLEMVDKKLTEFPKEDAERFINVALLCTQSTPKQRPTMFEVVYMLYGTHKSDLQISDMATRAIADPPFQRNNSTGAEMESRGDTVDETTSGNYDSIVVSNWTDVSESKGECSSSNSALAPLETGLASSSQQDQSCPEDLVRAYFNRSMDKIMRYHVARRRNLSDRTTIMSQTIVINKPPGNTFMEAVYPPFLTGEYPRPSLL